MAARSTGWLFGGFLALVIGHQSESIAHIVIPTVLVGHAGNPADFTPTVTTGAPPDPLTGFGSVPYVYGIGETEVTNEQYVAFLNAVAVHDTFGLYNSGMGDPSGFGGIIRLGAPGSYSYVVRPGRERHPACSVTFWSACRFANWLHNGQPAGLQSPSTTEDGAYTLTAAGIAANSVVRNNGWRWAVPSEDEWYKAAHYQPVSFGGDEDGYWLYPVSRNSIDSGAANYGGAVGDTTPARTYRSNYFGVFDLAGNVFEWNEAVLPIFSFMTRGIRGGSATFGIDSVRANNRDVYGPSDPAPWIGFRVVQRVCVADFDKSKFVDSDDFILFVYAFSRGCTGAGVPLPACFASADFDQSGFIDSDDFIAFYDAFVTPCEL